MGAVPRKSDGRGVFHTEFQRTTVQAGATTAVQGSEDVVPRQPCSDVFLRSARP